MENQRKPQLIRLSRTPKTNPRKNLCYKSLSTMGAKLVVFQPFTGNTYNIPTVSECVRSCALCFAVVENSLVRFFSDS